VTTDSGLTVDSKGNEINMTFNLSGTDWLTWFYPYASTLAYTTPQHYPPFTYLLLHPLTYLDPAHSYVALVLLSTFIIYLNVRSIPKLLLCLFCLPVAISVALGNVDALLALAFLLPTSLSALVVACKPQALALWWARRWMTSRHKLLGTLPLALALLGSLLLWGWWPGRLMGDALADNFLVSQLWPWTMLVGVPMLLTRRPVLWLVGGALCSPWLQFYHLTPLAVYVIGRSKWQVGVGMVVASWMVGVAMWG
jgi:hypothetical protein